MSPSWFYAALAVIGIVLFLIYHKIGRLIKCVLFTAFTGMGALGVVWILGRFMEMPLHVTPFTMCVSGILGIPGVVCMLLLRLI